MSVAVHVLTKSGRLTSFQSNILKNVRGAIKLARQQIPVGNVDLVIYDNPRAAVPETGEGGFTQTPHLLFIALNPGFNRFDWTIKDRLPRAVIHELHHAARWSLLKHDGTLLESLVSEGLATHFEEIFHSGEAALWAKAVTGKTLIELQNHAIKEYVSKKYSHRNWFFGGDPSIPRWTGYSIGYKLVEDYIAKHKSETAASLYNKPAKEFI